MGELERYPNTMGKKKGKKGKSKDPRMVANEYNEKLILAAMTNKPEKIIGNIEARAAKPDGPIITGVLELKKIEADLHAKAYTAGPESKEGKAILKTMQLGGAHEFIDVNYMNEPHNRTALMYASLQGFTQVVDCLLTQKADPNLSCPAGNTALHLAAHFGKHEVIGSLVEANANINQVDADGETPLHRAAFQGNEEAIECLLELNADLQTTDKDGRNPIAIAEVSKSLKKEDVVEMLHEAQRDYQRNKN